MRRIAASSIMIMVLLGVGSGWSPLSFAAAPGGSAGAALVLPDSASGAPEGILHYFHRTTRFLDLPERQRLALVLKRFEGMSQKDVAEAMGLSEKAVESLLVRALRGLRKSLGGE